MDCKIICLWTVVLLLAIPGCRKADPFEKALGLQSRRVVLSAETGITSVTVYSNTSWTVHFFPEVSWAGLDRLSGRNTSGVYFSYAANYNLARKVALAFEAGGVRDTVWMVQKGGLANPSIALSPQTLSLGAGETSGSAAVTTNLRSDWKDVVWKIDYIDGNPDWITEVRLSETMLSFDLLPNTGDSVRKAVITLSHTDAEDNEIKAMLTINQNPA